jgi:hypothetical protein
MMHYTFSEMHQKVQCMKETANDPKSHQTIREIVKGSVKSRYNSITANHEFYYEFSDTGGDQTKEEHFKPYQKNHINSKL